MPLNEEKLKQVLRKFQERIEKLEKDVADLRGGDDDNYHGEPDHEHHPYFGGPRSPEHE